MSRIDGRHSEQGLRFPTVRPEHRHVRELLVNAMRYLAPENKMVDPISGYPFEGWNQDPKKGLYLRSFTQLTAIGQYMELLANIVAGTCDTPYLSRTAGPRKPGAPGQEPAPGPARPAAQRGEPAGKLPRPGHGQAARPPGRGRREAQVPGRIR